jgi:PleD family two-component response regulator
MLLEADCRIRTRHRTVEAAISVGIAATRSCEGKAADILKRADRALYRTKRIGVTGLWLMSRKRSGAVS